MRIIIQRDREKYKMNIPPVFILEIFLFGVFHWFPFLFFGIFCNCKYHHFQNSQDTAIIKSTLIFTSDLHYFSSKNIKNSNVKYFNAHLITGNTIIRSCLSLVPWVKRKQFVILSRNNSEEKKKKITQIFHFRFKTLYWSE